MEGISRSLRKDLSMPGMLSHVRNGFDKIIDPLASKRSRQSLSDCLMSGLAIFSLKYPSLLAFNDDCRDEAITHNLSSLFGIEAVPSDTYMRERLDVVDPMTLRPVYGRLFALAQRGKVLEDYLYLQGSYLLSADGTGQFSSSTIHCENCNVKNHKSGKKTYYHQMLNAVIVHPDKREVLPLAPEAILKGDGATKNDCERNAAKRLFKHIRREHPHLKLTVIEDGLSSNGPHIQLLQSLDMHYILGAKPKDHKFLFEWVENSQAEEHEEIDPDGTIHRYRYLNNAPLNDTHFDLSVNFLDYEEIRPNGKRQHFSWVTDFTLSPSILRLIMKGGRARWKIENETFNTLKNQGYHYEHNFGHGKQHLCTVFSYLMMLAFFIDQLQQRCCQVFQAALTAARRKKTLWRRMQGLFTNFHIDSWQTLFDALIFKQERAPVYLNPA